MEEKLNLPLLYMGVFSGGITLCAAFVGTRYQNIGLLPAMLGALLCITILSILLAMALTRSLTRHFAEKTPAAACAAPAVRPVQPVQPAPPFTSRIHPVDLHQIAQEVMRELEPLAQAHAVTLRLSGKPAVLEGREGMLRELCRQLVDNAIRYNRLGGSVTVSIAGNARQVNLLVSDTGMGLSEEEQFAALNGENPALGLSIVRQIAQLHGGTVGVYSEEGVGSLFSVVFVPTAGAQDTAEQHRISRES